MKRDPGLVEIFIDKKTNTVRNEGEVYTFPLLGDTLARIARLVRNKGDTLARIARLVRNKGDTLARIAR